MAYAAGTEVPVDRSRREIEQLLQRHRAAQFMIGTDTERMLARVQFKLENRIVRFELGWDEAIAARVKIRNRAQLERQRWRALLLVIKAKLECVESGIATFEEEFLPYIVLPNDQTVAQNVMPALTQAYADGKMPRMLLGLPESTERPKDKPK